jgi:putative flippase GtrA
MRIEVVRDHFGCQGMTQPRRNEIHPQPHPVVPIPQDPFIPRRRLQLIVDLFPAGQFTRYVCVGLFNSVFGYANFAIILALLNRVLPLRFLYLTVVLASILSIPLNISVSYLTYKFFVFRTKGNYLGEWFKCFAVYGTGMIPGLIAVSALTRILQALIHSHAASLHFLVLAMESHLSGAPLAFLQHIATGKAMAGYIGGALFMGTSTLYGFIGHKMFTFRPRKWL